MLKNIIVPIFAGSSEFTGYTHTANFNRYLMSMTKKHPTNEKTKRNYVCIPSANIDGVGLAGEDSRKAIGSCIKKSGASYEDLKNDLCYWAYAIEVNGRVLSNFAQTNINTGIIEADNEILELISSSRMSKNKLSFDEIDQRIEALGAKFGKIVNADEATPQERHIIEKMFYSIIEKSTGITPIVHVSHLDQEGSLHHTHRIYDARGK